MNDRAGEPGSGDRLSLTGESDLGNSAEFLRLVIENIPAMVAVKDAKDLRFVLLNRAGEELTGIRREESIGKNDFDFFPREQAEFFISLDRHVLESGELRVIPEEQISTRHKGVRTLRTLKMPVLDAEGRPAYLLAMSEDITERKQAQEALRASEAMFGSLMLASADAIMAVDERGTIVRANERFRTMFGYGPEELIGQPAATLMAATTLEDYVESARRAFMDGTRDVTSIQDLVGRRRDGTEFPMEASVTPYGTQTGQMVIVSMRDVTERKEAEDQLRQAYKMEAIGNLTGGLAHDFNNLLSIVIGNLDLLREQLNDRPAADEFAGEALDAALRGAELTKRLLAFARRQPLQPRVLAVNDLVGGTEKLLTRTLGGNIEIEFRPGADVWPVTADPAQLENCLVNLAANARDAMQDGGKLTIVTDNRVLDEDYASMHPGLAPGEYTLIEVSDTGTGMTKEVLDKVFEPFFTTKKEGRGTGLGLSMVFGFMKQSGGHINVYSELGVGTTFRLYLPRAVTADSVVEKPEPAASVGGRETVLAVEDNADLRSVVVKQLTQFGYRCLEATDGPSALRVLETEKVDLLFSDVIMPGGMSGYELAGIAMERWPGLKVLLTSGFPEEKLNGNGNGHQPGSMRLLTKPYRKDDLARALRDVFAG